MNENLDLELMVIQSEALFTHDGHGRLLCINEPETNVPAPRLFLGRTRIGNIWRFRADLPDDLTSELEKLCADEPVIDDLKTPPRHQDEYQRLLEKHAPVKKFSSGPAYYFEDYPEPATPLVAIIEANSELLRGGFEDCLEEVPTWQPFIAAVENNRAVSVCRSVRITAAAHEAGVETLPEFRGRGYAKDVVAGWALAVKSLGAVPLYSTSWDNVASQAVARKLGLKLFGADFDIT